jgi:chemotaxis protein CheZ
VLNATDSASPLQEQLASDVHQLGDGWQRLFNHQMDVPEFRELAFRTRDFFIQDAPPRIQQTQSHLTEIMMAQDFQDLTGQVIKKVVGLAQDLEKGLLQLLVEVIPEGAKKEEANNLLNGPVISAEGRSDVVASQQQVDDLLDSLGF